MPGIPFMRAHGHVPGPTQRPAAAGLIDGVLAAIPALALMWLSGDLHRMIAAEGLPLAAIVALHAAALCLAGAVYGRLFGRTANDREGGWLFGISYGFVVWMLGPGTILQWVFGRPLAVGRAGQVLCGAYLLYGLVLGLLFPYLHAFLQRELK